MTAASPELAGGFPAPTRQDWQAEVLTALNRQRTADRQLTLEQAMSRLTTTTVDELVIEPLYTGDPRALGHPGVSPFTRGASVRAAGTPAWDVAAFHEDGDSAFSNAAALADLSRGATSLWLRVDPDSIAPDDLEAVLDGVLPALAPLRVSSRTDQDAAAQSLAEVWRAGADAARVGGSLGLDALGHAALSGERPDLAPQRHWVAVALAEFPHARAIAVDVLPYDDAGAGDVDLLAFAVATGVDYLRDLEQAGVGPRTAFGQIAFRVPANADQFLTIARLRALRRLWARVGEVSGVPAAGRGAVQWAVTSRRMITRDDTWVNLLRATVATFGAAAGGAEAITVLPHDTAWGLPGDFSRRMARNVQLLAAEESNLGRVADPAGGSWYVESLTDQLARRAWTRFQQLETAGGMGRAITDGRVAEAIEATASARALRIADRSQPITGVSTFPAVDERAPQVRPRPVALRVGGLQPHRDSEVFEALRDRVAAATDLPEVLLACLGEPRDYGASQQFASNVLLVAGIAHRVIDGVTAGRVVRQAVSAEAAAVVLCSSPTRYRADGIELATALKRAGVAVVLIAGRRGDTGPDRAGGLIDGELVDGMNVPDFLTDLLDRLGRARTEDGR